MKNNRNNKGQFIRKSTNKDGMRYCPDCDKVKPLSEFYNSKNRPQGVSSSCKNCAKIRTKTFQFKNTIKNSKIDPYNQPGRKTKVCTKCTKRLSLINFSRCKATKDGLRFICKSCASKQFVLSYEKNGVVYRAKSRLRKQLSKNKKLRRNNALKENFGITLREYNKLLKEQNHRCVICKRKNPDPLDRALHVDHDHKTGKVRGLLCSNCNTGIGMFHEDIKCLSTVIKYLREHGVK